ncbi:imidazole glycerol phosphate synthase subunit HisH [Campylobacter geochelonis]|uniref:imidazole glycerol phosphate synthase subunit HisH n=1 Tax=Campylobacter geochelonis TaxID=1780362 RepID=UPI000770AEFC|nr:imidazole glycerol phosphate synthase subunit HisH [Campylobacter geochelonis]CZE50949.1 imidazole glycerol phosphate synthase subunit HisH [Campylobacter geochelonis]
MIGIIDYGAGNIQSVVNALDFVGAKSSLVKNGDDVSKFDKILLPGVGAFSDAMSKLKDRNLDQALREFVKSGKPFLGICLGLQLLFKESDEFGLSKGLGILDGRVVKFDKTKFSQNEHLKIPHIGWNTMEFTRDTKLNLGLNKSAYLYFVHSYHVECGNDIVLAKSKYGYEFVSAVCKDNIFAIQPHPEKSHENGIKILKNFVEL